MKCYEEKRSKQIYDIVSTAKLLSILLCGIIFFSVYGERTNASSPLNGSGIDPFSIAFILIVVLALIYKAWTFSNGNKGKHGIGKGTFIEVSVFIIVFFALVLLSGAYDSQYKAIFLFIIATSTIELGKKCGMYIASLCGTLLLLMDFILAPQTVSNHYFEADLVLLGIFVLTAWLLGDYVEIEKKHREKITTIANIDDLTGVYNHRFFQQSIDLEVKRSQQSNQSVSLLFIDIDYFKNYNDLYGHLVGDKILAQIAGAIKENVREGDIVARYGGEEFAVILPHTEEETAKGIGEQIRREIDQMYFPGEENLPSKKLTVSIGLSCYPQKAKSKLELINSADDALYRAKFFDKNRVEVYFSILEELRDDIEEEHIDIITSIKTLISIINAKDKYTYGHTERVVIYCDLIAEQLNLPEEDKKILKYGAYLHDIGKIEILPEVLNKRARLTDEEWQQMRKHPENGAEIIKSVPCLQKVIPLILYHHERYDGAGYPAKLRGEEIPVLARIVSVADSFDAMTSNRPYQIRKSYEEAIDELKRNKFTQFDPAIVDAFIEGLSHSSEKSA